MGVITVPRRHRARRPVSVLQVYTAIVILFLFLPLFVVVLFSFNSSQALAFPIEGLSLRWYAKLGDGSTQFGEAVATSIKLGLVAAIGSTIAATSAALAATHYRVRGDGVLRAGVLLPAAVPELAIAVMLLAMYIDLHIRLGFWTATVGHVIYVLPFVFLVAYSRLARLDPRLEEAARDLGASRPQAFRLVMLPLIFPVIVGGAFVALALSFDEFFISNLTIGTGLTVPILIWTKARTTIDPTVNAISAILLATSLFLAVTGVSILGRRNP